MTTPDYIFIGITILVYGFTFIYQNSRLKTLETILKSQNDFINTYEQYKKMLNDTLDLRLQKQKEELDASFRKQSKIIAEQTLETAFQTFQRESEKMAKGWEELSQIAISITIKQFPAKADKIKRDEYLNKNYPNNAEYFIKFIDDFLNGKIKLDK